VSRRYQRHLRVVALKPNKDLVYLSELFAAGKLHPVIDGAYDFADVPNAFRRFGSGDHTGKIVVRRALVGGGPGAARRLSRRSRLAAAGSSAHDAEVIWVLAVVLVTVGLAGIVLSALPVPS
jgi:hypothetical protein